MLNCVMFQVVLGAGAGGLVSAAGSAGVFAKVGST